MATKLEELKGTGGELQGYAPGVTFADIEEAIEADAAEVSAPEIEVTSSTPDSPTTSTTTTTTTTPSEESDETPTTSVKISSSERKNLIASGDVSKAFEAEKKFGLTAQETATLVSQIQVVADEQAEEIAKENEARRIERNKREEEARILKEAEDKAKREKEALEQIQEDITEKIKTKVEEGGLVQFLKNPETGIVHVFTDKAKLEEAIVEGWKSPKSGEVSEARGKNFADGDNVEFGTTLTEEESGSTTRKEKIDKALEEYVDDKGKINVAQALLDKKVSSSDLVHIGYKFGDVGNLSEQVRDYETAIAQQDARLKVTEKLTSYVTNQPGLQTGEFAELDKMAKEGASSQQIEARLKQLTAGSTDVVKAFRQGAVTEEELKLLYGDDTKGIISRADTLSKIEPYNNNLAKILEDKVVSIPKLVEAGYNETNLKAIDKLNNYENLTEAVLDLKSNKVFIDAGYDDNEITSLRQNVILNKEREIAVGEVNKLLPELTGNYEDEITGDKIEVPENLIAVTFIERGGDPKHLKNMGYEDKDVKVATTLSSFLLKDERTGPQGIDLEKAIQTTLEKPKDASEIKAALRSIDVSNDTINAMTDHLKEENIRIEFGKRIGFEDGDSPQQQMNKTISFIQKSDNNTEAVKVLTNAGVDTDFVKDMIYLNSKDLVNQDGSIDVYSADESTRTRNALLGVGITGTQINTAFRGRVADDLNAMTGRVEPPNNNPIEPTSVVSSAVANATLKQVQNLNGSVGDIGFTDSNFAVPRPTPEGITAVDKEVITPEGKQKIKWYQRDSSSLGFASEYGVIPAEIEAEDADGELYKIPAQDFVRDILKEAMTFGVAETESFNTKAIAERYDTVKDDMGHMYDWDTELARRTAAKEGKELNITTSKEDWIKENLGTKKEYVQQVLDSGPTLKKIAAEFGIAMVPIWGTAHTWSGSPNWARGVSVGADVLTVIPIVGQLAAASKVGTSLSRTALRLAMAEFTAPYQMVRHPVTTVKSAVQPFQSWIYPKRIPYDTFETKVRTGRLQVGESPLEDSPGMVYIPESVVQGIDINAVRLKGIEPTSLLTKGEPDITKIQEAGLDPEKIIVPKIDAQIAMAARDEATVAMIKGERGVLNLNDDMQAVLPAPSFQKHHMPAAMHSTADVRNHVPAQVVEEGKEGLGLFTAPSAMSGFQAKSAFGNPDLSPGAQSLVQLGKLSDEAMPGFVLYTDPKLIDILENGLGEVSAGSNKLWQGTVEIERVLPPGTQIPAASQLLTTRNTFGEVVTIVIKGPPLNPAQIAKLKILGPVESISQALSKIRGSGGAGTFKGPSNKSILQLDEAIENANQAGITLDKLDDVENSFNALKRDANINPDDFVITKDSPLNMTQGIETMATKDPSRYRSILENQNELRNLKRQKPTPEVLKRIDDLELNIKIERQNWSRTTKENLRVAVDVDNVPNQIKTLRKEATDYERAAERAVGASNKFATSQMLKGLTKTTLYFGDDDIAGSLEAITGRRPINLNSEDGYSGIYARGRDGSTSNYVATNKGRAKYTEQEASRSVFDTPRGSRSIDVTKSAPVRGRGEVVVQNNRVVSNLGFPERTRLINVRPDGIRTDTPYTRTEITRGDPTAYRDIGRVTTDEPRADVPIRGDVTRPDVPGGVTRTVPDPPEPERRIDRPDRPDDPARANVPDPPESPRRRDARPQDPTRTDTAKPSKKDKKKKAQPRSKWAPVAWRQGFVYVIVKPPYNQNDVEWTRRKPEGVPISKGPESAFKTITKYTGKVPSDIMIKLGFYNVDIGFQGTRIEFTKNPNKVLKGVR